MAKILLQPADYTFSAASKTITFDNVGTLVLENVLIITNLVDGLIVYNFADPAKSGTVATNVLTLEYDTTSMSDTDALQIFYNDPALDTAGGPLVNLGTNNDVTVAGVAALTEQQTQTTHLATIAGDTTDIEAAIELLDDTVAVLGTDVYTEATSKGLVVGAVRRDADTTLVGTTNEVAPLQVDANGRLKVEAFSGETLPVSGTVTANLAAGTNNIGDVDVLTLPALPAGTNNIGDVDILSIVPGTGATNLGKAEDAAHTTGDVGIMALGVRAASPTERSAGPTDGDYEPVGINEVGALWVSTTPSANGGWTVFSLVSAATTNATNIKASAGKVGGWYIYNSNAAARKIAFHNASGTPTAGASVYFSIVIPPTSAANVEFANGIQFSTGIAITTVTGLAANDSAAVAANDLIIAIFYK